MKVGYLHIILFALCLVSCNSTKNMVSPMMEELRGWEKISGAYVQDSILYQCNDKTLHFLHYAYAYRDTVVMYTTTNGDTTLLGGISLYDDELSEEGDEYYHNSFDSLWIQTYKDHDFFVARAVSGGTGNAHKDNMFLINANDGTLEQVKIVRAADVYPQLENLPDNLAIWKDETRFYTQDSIYSVFCIWNTYDPNCCPTYGEVHSRYELKLAFGKTPVLIPATFRFTPYTEDYHPAWSVGE